MATNATINGKDYFRLTKTVGHKIVDGKRKLVRKTFYGTSRRDAEKKYLAWLGNQNKDSVDPLRLVSDLAKEFNSAFKNNDKFAQSTIDLYMGAYKTHFDDLSIGNIRIGELTGDHIQTAYEDLKISEDALVTLHKWMKHFIKYCQKRGYCNDVLSLVVMPKKKKVVHAEEIIVWEDDEIELVKNTMQEHPYYPCIMLALYAGLRVGEVLGLKWTDIRNNEIHVNRQLYRGDLKAPKYNSNRIIPLHPVIKKALEDYPRKNDYIFTTKSGLHIEYHNFKRSLERAYKKHNIPNKKFHAYRATFCTNLCRKGVPLEVASKLMGHKDIKVTAKHYALVKQDQMVDAILKL